MPGGGRKIEKQNGWRNVGMDGEALERRDVPLRNSEDVAVAGGGAMARLLGLNDENLEALEVCYLVSLSMNIEDRKSVV